MNKEKWPLVANTQISEYLTKSISNNKIGGAYIFCGPDDLGKTTLAKFFVQILLCQNQSKSNQEVLPCGQCASCKKFAPEKKSTAFEQGDMNEIHSDFHIIQKDKDKKNISIEQVRNFIHKLNLSSFSNSYKVGIIKNADTLSHEAANSLLKTLEEPKKKVLIILIAQDKETLPATIVSRSQILQFKPVADELIYEYLVDKHNVPREKARNISRLCLGRPALAVKLLRDDDYYSFYDAKVNAFLDMQAIDLAARFRLIENFFDKKASNQESIALAHGILRIWQGVVRDYILVLLGMHNRVQHIYIHDKLKNARQNKNLSDYARLSHSLIDAHKFLDANVNPRLVFESLAINI